MPKYLNLKTASAVLFCLFVAVCSYAIPAGRGILTLAQPDGYRFKVIQRGDEFMRILTTPEGESLIKDSDGYYCYGTYDPEGILISSGFRVGGEVPEEIRTASSDIPFGLLQQKAADLRRERNRFFNIEFPGQNTRGRHKAADINHRNVLVILVEFQDLEFHYTRQDFVNLMTQKGYLGFGCAKDYLEDQFMGKCTFQIDVSNIVTLPKGLRFYGENRNGRDADPVSMVEDACRAIDKETDFSRYDNDGDGFADNVFIFFAGGNEAETAETDYIWPHAWNIKDVKKLILDGVRIGSYACTSELKGTEPTVTKEFATIGTFCHEYSHTLGLVDLYDTDGNTSEEYYSAGTWGSTSLMDGGNYNEGGVCPPNYNALERWMLGITDIHYLENGPNEIGPIQKESFTHCIEGDIVDEFFLFEYRTDEGWDSSVKGKGMLVYHIDMSSNSAGFSFAYNRDVTAQERWLHNEVNASWERQCCDILEADGRKDFSTQPIMSPDIRTIFYPTATNNSLTPFTEPKMLCWSGNTIPRAVTDIRDNGHSVTFQVKDAFTSDPPYAKILRTDTFQDAFFIRWKSGTRTEGVSYLRCRHNQETILEKEVIGKDGIWEAAINGLEPKTAYSVEVFFKEEEIEGKASVSKFTTKNRSEDNPQYIYLKNCPRNDDWSFPKGSEIPLKVYNDLEKEKNTEWYFDDVYIGDDGTPYFILEKSGKLKAVCTYDDGSSLIIVKNMIVGK